MESFKRVYGLEARVEAVCARSEKTKDFALKYGIPKVYSDYRDLLKDPDIEVADICTPPQLHAPMIEEFLTAGKHVVSEKPFTGYFGLPGDEKPIGKGRCGCFLGLLCGQVQAPPVLQRTLRTQRYLYSLFIVPV